jgi:hypothetical protein
MSEDHRSCDKVMPLEMASNNAKTSSLFDDILQGMKQVHLTLKTAVQNRRENRDRMKIEEKNIVKSGCFEHFVCVVSTSSGKVDITSMSMT